MRKKDRLEPVDFDPQDGYPAARNLYYKCGRCGVLVPSMPPATVRCDCGNLTIDVDAGRLSVREPSELKLFRAHGKLSRLPTPV